MVTREEKAAKAVEALPSVRRWVVAYHEAGHAVIAFRHGAEIINPGIRAGLGGDTFHKNIRFPMDLDLSGLPQDLRPTARLVMIQRLLADVEILLAGHVADRRFIVSFALRSGNLHDILVAGYEQDHRKVVVAFKQLGLSDEMHEPMRRCCEERVARLLRYAKTWRAVEALVNAVRRNRWRLSASKANETLVRVRPPRERPQLPESYIEMLRLAESLHGDDIFRDP